MVSVPKKIAAQAGLALTLAFAAAAPIAEAAPITLGAYTQYDMDLNPGNGYEGWLDTQQNKIFAVVPEGLKTYTDANTVTALFNETGLSIPNFASLDPFISGLSAEAVNAGGVLADFLAYEAERTWLSSGSWYDVTTGMTGNALDVDEINGTIVAKTLPGNIVREPGTLLALAAAGMAGVAVARRRATSAMSPGHK